MKTRKVIVIGLDGLDPRIVGRMLAAGELPALARLRRQGGCAPVATTVPAQTPVAWATFSTGTNPGGHGIFDFIRRDPQTYRLDLALNRHERTSPFLPPRVVNLRRGTPLWQLLTAAGVRSVILRCPCTYGPDEIRGRMLAGMGVPDLRGGLGTSTFYTSADDVRAKQGERLIRVEPDGGLPVRTHLVGPRHPKTGSDCRVDVTIEADRDRRQVVVRSAGSPGTLVVRQGEWSGWLRVKFKVGVLQAIRGIVRFFLVGIAPRFELYASPVNFDPQSPPFAISSPPSYARRLADELGTFYTAGMVEDQGGLDNGRFDEDAYLAQCDDAWREREAMMLRELDRGDEGLFFCLFDTPDRVQHMFWRCAGGEPSVGDGWPPGEANQAIAETYRKSDLVVQLAMQYADDRTLLIVLSDHGFGSFRRGLNLNTWLHGQGLLALKKGVQPGEEAGDLLQNVDWGRTKACAVGLGGIYLNRQGREAQGTVSQQKVAEVEQVIIKGLTELRDPLCGTTPVRSVVARRQVYSGRYAAESPDLLVNFADGYRVSWGTALGGLSRELFEDNRRKWSGDHAVDPALVPGVLLMNRPFRGQGARLVDLAPTILEALGVAKGAAMEGEALLP